MNDKLLLEWMANISDAIICISAQNWGACNNCHSAAVRLYLQLMKDAEEKADDS